MGMCTNLVFEWTNFTQKLLPPGDNLQSGDKYFEIFVQLKVLKCYLELNSKRLSCSWKEMPVPHLVEIKVTGRLTSVSYISHNSDTSL